MRVHQKALLVPDAITSSKLCRRLSEYSFCSDSASSRSVCCRASLRALLSSNLPDGGSDLCSIAVGLHATAVCVRILQRPLYGAQIGHQEATQPLTAIDKGFREHALQTCLASGSHVAIHCTSASTAAAECELSCEEQSSTQSMPVNWRR